jgi:hypothetical protein
LLCVTTRCDVAPHDYGLELRNRLRFAFIRRRGRVVGGDDGHASFCLSGHWGGSLNGHRNGPSNESLEVGKVYCPSCRQQHQIAGIEYWLAEVRPRETTHEEDPIAA